MIRRSRTRTRSATTSRTRSGGSLPGKTTSYELSPRAADHVEARHIRDFGSETNLAPVGMSRGMRNWTGSGFKFDPKTYGAIKLGSGAYGTAYRVSLGASMVEFLVRVLNEGTLRVIGSAPRAGSQVVIKVARRPSSKSVDEFLRDAVREAAFHQQIMGAGSCSTAGCSKVCPSDVVPPFYFSAYSGGKKGVYLTVMGLVEGTSVGRFLKRARLTAETYVAIEKAAATMWLAGTAHADFHTENVMIHGDKVSIIDFGFGVVLDPRLRATVEGRVRRGILEGSRSLGSVWDKTDLGGYVNRVQAKRFGRRSGAWYNPDGRAIKAMYNRLSASERARVPNARLRAWRCSGTVEAPKPGGAPTKGVRLPSPKPKPKAGPSMLRKAAGTRLPSKKSKAGLSMLRRAAAVPIDQTSRKYEEIRNLRRT